MNSANINHIDIIKQDARMVTLRIKRDLSLINLLHNLIREYGVSDGETYYIDAGHLSTGDKRLLLSHHESLEFIEYAYESEIKTNELFNEDKKYYQRILDDECYECYQNVMEEMMAYR